VMNTMVEMRDVVVKMIDGISIKGYRMKIAQKAYSIHGLS